MKGPITRKEFLATTTKSVAAASIGALGVSLIAANGDQVQRPITVSALQSVAWPWPYSKLDQDDVRKRAHKAYYDGGCGYGAFNAIITALVDAVGEPFTLMPPQVMYFAGGGGAGWGTLCGAINGSAVAISLVVDRANASAIIGELFGWYTQAQFPSDISNDYAAHHLFLINRYDKALKQTVSGSPLCHTSVSSWCTESGFKATAGERAERCARLTGDVAAKAVEMLNQFVDGRFRATFVPPRSVQDCLGCHDAAAIGNVNPTVKMDCQQCHKDNWDHLY